MAFVIEDEAMPLDLNGKLETMSGAPVRLGTESPDGNRQHYWLRHESGMWSSCSCPAKDLEKYIRNVPLKLERDKVYKSRDGQKWYCLGIVPPEFRYGCHNDYPVYCVCEDGRGEDFTEDGQCYLSTESPNDLIAEWEDDPVDFGDDEVT